MRDHHSYVHNLGSCENKAWNKIQVHHICNNSVVLNQLSYQTNWELLMLLVCNIPEDGEE